VWRWRTLAAFMPLLSRNFTLEEARKKIVAKLRKAGAKGAASPVTAKTPAAQRETYEEALGEMAAAGSLVAVPVGAKTKYFLPEFAPSAATAAVKIERLAAAKHPVLLAVTDFKKALSPPEKSFLPEAVQHLESATRLIKLVRGKAFVFAHADSLRALLGQPARNAAAVAIDGPQLRGVYRALAARTGFPAVEIAALQHETAVPLSELKSWLLAEHRSGRAVFGLGDWSLADDAARAAAIELRGDRHLLVRLED
jgi:hypothetical protein